MGIYHHITYRGNTKGKTDEWYASKVINKMPLYYLRDARKNNPTKTYHIVYSKEITKEEYDGMNGKLD